MKIDVTNRKERTLFILMLGALTMLGPMAVDLYLPALPAIAQAMEEPLSKIQFTLSAYIISFAFGQLIYGPISDRFGRQKIILLGIIFFFITSLASALSSNAMQLSIIRILQAMSGAAVMVTIPAMVNDLFPKKDSAKALSSILLVMVIAPLVAPILGGQILKFMNWQALFLFLAVLSALIFFLAAIFIPETLPEDRRQAFTIHHVSLNYLNILTNKNAMGCILSNSFFFAGMFAFISGSPFVYIKLFGIKPEYYGFLYGANILAIAVANITNLKLINQFKLFNILRSGSLIASAAGIIVLLNVKTGFGGLLGIILPIMLYAASMGLTSPNSNALALAQFPNSAATANAVFGALRFSFGGLASAIVGYFNDGTALPMATVIATCGILSFIPLLLVKHHPTAIGDNDKHIKRDPAIE
ncbi:MAG: Bcr/CflA family multidrug efflux MFS transporter [Endozoicomonas sp. (ex Botrylloides leachii)]|nr:Bcr/CflA family multidrug efflux MFS transporter [Endozoicomonas sp. (ex Botrylloides leachii)]